MDARRKQLDLEYVRNSNMYEQMVKLQEINGKAVSFFNRACPEITLI